MKNFVKCKIKELKKLNEEYIHLKISIPIPNFKPLPGQFVMLSLESFEQTFPRPFSVLNYEKNCLEILIKKIGRFTKRISKIKNCETLNLTGPLGNIFEEEENLIIVAGGYGIAPLYFFLKKYKNLKNVKLFYGGKSKNDLLFLKDLKKILNKDSLYLTTEDGTEGERSVVTDPLLKFLKKNKKYKKIYGCGPIPMFKALNEISKNFDLKFFASMDPIMACGYGVCLGCVIPTISGNLCACIDGPIFDSSIILWDKI